MASCWTLPGKSLVRENGIQAPRREADSSVSSNSLHVTNGDSVLYSWKKGGLLGTYLAWRDVLHEGPVPPGLPLEQLSRVRAAYLASRGYGNPIKLQYEFEKRDALMRRAREFEEVVLWFEHDLYDQLHLLQVLAVLREANLGAGHVQLIQSDQYLGMLSPDELLALYPKRRYATAGIEEAAAGAWEAFTGSSPEALAAMIAQRFAGLPFLRDALYRLCEEYPDSQSGLSRTQKHIVEACAQGARRKEDIFRLSQAREEAAFLGDAACYSELNALCAQPAPLVTLPEQGCELTVLGRRVLAGDTDWLEHQPLDRWIGGVHLTTGRHWRWNESDEAFEKRGQHDDA